jgi:L-cysteine S-thiosulfotransferase
MNENRMRRGMVTGLSLAACGLAAAACTSYPDQATTRQLGEKMVAEAYPGMPPTLVKRSVQDKAQQICSRVGDATLSQQDAAEVAQASRTEIKYPASGKLVGDWKIGARLVLDGGGMRVRGGRVEKVKENGALCVNCHALDPKEVNAGNLGPSLTGFGSQRGNSEATIKYAYEKIYDAWAYFPCSNMPRLGHGGFLTPEQITHVVAYLVDPQSPVNKK